jgi:acyl-CoA thioesterase-1
LETLYNSIMNRFQVYSDRFRSRARLRILNRFLLYVILIAISVLTACRATAPKEASPASPAAPAKPAKSLPKIVAFGDSLTAGLGLPQSASYPALLQKKLDADGFAYEVVNAGVSGDTSAGGVRRIDWALEGDVKIVIVELGANDILRGQSVDAMKENLARIIERVKAHGATVLLAGMEAPTNSGIEYRKAIHEAFPSLSRKYNVPVIPFFLDGVAGIDSLNQRDGIHPNEEGTKIVTETVYRSLRPLLGKHAL